MTEGERRSLAARLDRAIGMHNELERCYEKARLERVEAQRQRDEALAQYRAAMDVLDKKREELADVRDQLYDLYRTHEKLVQRIRAWERFDHDRLTGGTGRAIRLRKEDS